jgi:hypothetical protein
VLGRPAGLSGAQLGHEGVDPDIRRQRLSAMQPRQRGEQPTFGGLPRPVRLSVVHRSFLAG